MPFSAPWKWSVLDWLRRRARPIHPGRARLWVEELELRLTRDGGLSSLGPLLVNSFRDAPDADPDDGLAWTGLFLPSGERESTLRAAIQQANATSGQDLILLPAGTYLLDLVGADEDLGVTGDLDITDSLALLGKDSTPAVIDGNALGDRLIDIQAGAEGLVSLAGLVLRGGNANRNGGAIRAHDAVVDLNNVWIHDNRSGGQGGGLDYSGAGGLRLTSVTLSDNWSGMGGGGLAVNGAARLTNVTFSRNVASLRGGALLPLSQTDVVLLSNVTLHDNTALIPVIYPPPVIPPPTGAVQVHNSILADFDNVLSTNLISLGHNLDSNGSARLDDETDLLGDPLLAPLAASGGMVPTHALRPGSPALDAGDSSLGLQEDARGVARPQGHQVDIGAHEGGAAVLGVNYLNPPGTYVPGQSVDISIGFSSPVTVDVNGGTPALTLNTGGLAYYLSGSGSTNLLFRYTITLGEEQDDLQYTGAAALLTAGGSITDAGGIPADLTLPSSSMGGGNHSDIIIDDDATPPIILLTGSSGYAYDGDTQQWNWDVSDESDLNAVNVSITRDGTEIFHSSSTTGTFNFDALGFGYYEIRIVATDADSDRPGDELTATVTESVTVVDDDSDEPSIWWYGPSGMVDDTSSLYYQWGMYEPSGATVTVTITRDGEVLFTSEQVSGSFDLPGLGDYQFSIAAVDNDTDWEGDRLEAAVTDGATIVDDDATPPVITLNGSSEAENDGQTQEVAWDVTDESGLSSVMVTGTRNGETVFISYDAGGYWNFDHLGTGEFVLTIAATDNDYDRSGDKLDSFATRTVTVSDDDPTAPGINISGPTGSVTDDTLPVLSWTTTDLDSGIHCVEVSLTLNGVEVFTSKDAAGDVSPTDFGLGDFVLTVTASDTDQDWYGDALTTTIQHTLTVISGDTEPPVIVLGGSEGFETDDLTQEFSWQVQPDVSGIASVWVVVYNADSCTSLFTSSAESGTFNFDFAGPGTYTLEVTAVDGRDLSRTVTRTVTVEDDDKDAPDIELQGADTAEQSDDQTQQFAWTIADLSGIHSYQVEIFSAVDGEQLLYSENGAGIPNVSGSFNFDEYGPGEYTIRVYAQDDDLDQEADSLETFITATVTVTDDDQDGPAILLGGSMGVQPGDDSSGRSFTWAITDASGIENATIGIYRDGELLTITAELNGDYNFADLGYGYYELRVTALDADADWSGDNAISEASRSVLVIPTSSLGESITLGDNAEVQTDAEPQAFTWSYTRSSTDNFHLYVFQNDALIYTTTERIGEFTFDDFGLGEYQLVLTVSDPEEFADSARQWVTVIDDDDAAPAVTVSGNQENQNDGDLQELSWEAVDGQSDPSQVSVYLYQFICSDYQEVMSSFANPGSINFDALGPGEYYYWIEAGDADSDWSGDTAYAVVEGYFTVVDDDNQAPTIGIASAGEDITGGSTTATTSDPPQLTWSVNDASGLAEVTVTITRAGSVIFTSGEASGHFDLAGQEPGDYVLAITASDGDADWTNDASTSSATALISLNSSGDAAPVITLGGSEGSELDSDNQSFSWAVSEVPGLRDVVVAILKNEEALSPLSIHSGVLDFNNLGPGSFQMVVTASYTTVTDPDTIQEISATRSVLVLDDDGTPPSIVLGGSSGTESESAPNGFTWAVSDDSGVAVQIVIYRDSEVIYSANDASGGFSLDELGPGTYDLIVTATDQDADWDLSDFNDSLPASAQRSVVVQAAAPPIILGGSSAFETDQQTQVFTWDIATSGLLSQTITITRDEQVIASCASSSGMYNFDALGPANYQITVLATFQGSDGPIQTNATRSVLVSDDDVEPPTITLEGSTAAEPDSVLQEFTWAISDPGDLQGTHAVVTRDGEVVFTSTDSQGSFNFDAFGTGTYVLTVSATDADADWEGDAATLQQTRSVVVSDDDVIPPTITIIPGEGNQADAAEQRITWEVQDDSGPSSVQVTLSRDNVPILSSDQPCGGFTFDEYGPGVYELTVIATDADGDWESDALTATHTATLTVVDDDTTGPTIVLGGSQGIETDADFQELTWDVSDVSDLDSVEVTLTRNGQVIYQGGGASGTIEFNHPGAGVYHLHVTATDADADWTDDITASSADRWVSVLDDDPLGPTITLGGSVGPETDADSQEFTWEVSDPSDLNYVEVRIYRADSLVYYSNSTSDTFNFDDLGAGEYLLDVRAWDADHDSHGDLTSARALRRVTVTDDDTLPPVISLGGSSGAASDGQVQEFTWDISDASGLSESNVIVTRDGDIIFTSSEPSGFFNFEDLGLGFYELSVTAADADGDVAFDTLSSSATQQVLVSDDDTEAPSITLDGSTGNETDGQPQEFTWAVGDASGLAQINVTICAGEMVLYSGSAGSGTFNFDVLGPGTYSIFVNALDADNDRAYDALGSQAMRTVTVVEDDTAPPLIFVGGSSGIEADPQAQFFTWVVTDASPDLSVTATVTRNGTLVYTSTAAQDSFSFDALGPGQYELVVTADDRDLDWEGDNLVSSMIRSVTVLDDDVQAPSITLGGATGVQLDGDTQEFTWESHDLDTPTELLQVTVILTRDGREVLRSNLPQGQFNFDALGVGHFQIMVTVTDADADWPGDENSITLTRTVQIEDDDVIPPRVLANVGLLFATDAGAVTGQAASAARQAFVWEIPDLQDVAGFTLSVTRNGVVVFQDDQPLGKFIFEELGPGQYQLTITAVDTDSDWEGDQLTTTSVQTVVVTPAAQLVSTPPATTASTTASLSTLPGSVSPGLAEPSPSAVQFPVQAGNEAARTLILSGALEVTSIEVMVTSVAVSGPEVVVQGITLPLHVTPPTLSSPLDGDDNAALFQMVRVLAGASAPSTLPVEHLVARTPLPAVPALPVSAPEAVVAGELVAEENLLWTQQLLHWMAGAFVAAGAAFSLVWWRSRRPPVA